MTTAHRTIASAADLRREELLHIAALVRARASPHDLDGRLWLVFLDDDGEVILLRRTSDPLRTLDALHVRDLAGTVAMIGAGAVAVVVHRADGIARRVDRRLGGALVAAMPHDAGRMLGVAVIGPDSQEGAAVCFPLR